MKPPDADRIFAGSIPQLYERYLVPLIFEPYAADLASRVAPREPSRVLEVAAGTGVVTRQLANALPPSVSIVATDLNQPMLDQAAAAGITRPVEWRQADAMQLPLPDEAFDMVVCQFAAYHDLSAIAQDLACGGFDRLPEFTTLAARSRADSPRIPAVAYCHGTPLSSEIGARGPSRVAEATEIATAAIASRFGSGAVDGQIQAHIITIER